MTCTKEEAEEFRAAFELANDHTHGLQQKLIAEGVMKQKEIIALKNRVEELEYDCNEATDDIVKSAVSVAEELAVSLNIRIDIFIVIMTYYFPTIHS